MFTTSTLKAQIHGTFGESFGLSDFIAIETLLTALYAAFFLTSGRHRLVKEAFTAPTAITAASACVALATPLTLAPALYGFNVNSALLWSIILLMAVLVVLLGVNSLRYFQESRFDLGFMLQENVINEATEAERVSHNRNVVAVTETGAYDCDYLHEDVISTLDNTTIDAYLRELWETGYRVANAHTQLREQGNPE